VDDVASVQATGRRGDRCTDLDRALRHRLALDLLAAGPLQRARDPRPHPEMVVRGVGDRVGLDRGDVALTHLELHGESIVAACC
jgi:hypothetical protein